MNHVKNTKGKFTALGNADLLHLVDPDEGYAAAFDLKKIHQNTGSGTDICQQIAVLFGKKFCGDAKIRRIIQDFETSLESLGTKLQHVIPWIPSLMKSLTADKMPKLSVPISPVKRNPEGQQQVVTGCNGLFL